MGKSCRCGSEVSFAFNHLGCIQCGSPCCPACSHELESTTYCSACAAPLLGTEEPSRDESLAQSGRR